MLGLLLCQSPLSHAGKLDHCNLEFARLTENKNAIALITTRKAGILYPEIPSSVDLHLPTRKPDNVHKIKQISAGVSDPILERARNLRVFEDFKPLSDARPKPMTEATRREIKKKARAAHPNDEAKFLRMYIENAYEFGNELNLVVGLAPPLWRINTGDKVKDAAFSYTEIMWEKLLRNVNPKPGGSLLKAPYPILVPGGRFTETYYWDTYFSIRGLLSTGRIELAQMQTENLLSFVRRYGFVPNGNRDYYLTRSQPPFLSSTVREVFEATIKAAKSSAEKERALLWLKKRAYPLVRNEYENFWMNPQTRFDSKFGLNHHWDDLNLPRPERHAHDDEGRIGKTFRDVRAAAESGLDFTAAHEAEASQIAPILLNSMLYKTERDLEWMARLINEDGTANLYSRSAEVRAARMHALLWNEKAGQYENFNLRKGKRVPATTADTFAPLYVGLASTEEARRVRDLALPRLERKAGVMASNLSSSHQWDGDNGWAPQQIFAVAGLRNYNYKDDAKRLAIKWTDAIKNIYRDDRTMYERINVTTASKPLQDKTKYPTQEGFLWTNSSYVWMLLDVLEYKKLPMHLD